MFDEYHIKSKSLSPMFVFVLLLTSLGMTASAAEVTSEEEVQNIETIKNLDRPALIELAIQQLNQIRTLTKENNNLKKQLNTDNTSKRPLDSMPPPPSLKQQANGADRDDKNLADQELDDFVKKLREDRVDAISQAQTELKKSIDTRRRPDIIAAAKQRLTTLRHSSLDVGRPQESLEFEQASKTTRVLYRFGDKKVYLLENVLIAQIVNGDEALVREDLGHRERPLIWVKGYDTSKINNGQHIGSLHVQFLGNRQYAGGLGTVQTVPGVRFIESERFLFSADEKN